MSGILLSSSRSFPKYGKALKFWRKTKKTSVCYLPFLPLSLTDKISQDCAGRKRAPFLPKAVYGWLIMPRVDRMTFNFFELLILTLTGLESGLRAEHLSSVISSSNICQRQRQTEEAAIHKKPGTKRSEN